MAIEIGTTIEGTIVKLADYGAIVRLAGGKVGLVHISEVAETYVRDVHDHFSENDRVLVKVLKVNDKGRYELSVKQADAEAVARVKPKPQIPVDLTPTWSHYDENRRDSRPATFEDRLNRFMKDSEERQLDLKRSVDSKRGGSSRRK